MDESPDQNATRRNLHRQPRRPWWTNALIAGVTLAMIGGTYGFVAAGTQPDPTTEVSDVPEVRDTPVSRSVDRLPLDDGEERTFTLTLDGEEQEITTRARTLAEALAEAGIEVGFDDEVSAPMHEAPTDVTIGRVEESIETVKEKVPFKTKETKTDSLLKGETKVKTKGKDGQRTATKRVKRKGDQIVSEEILAQAVGSEPVVEEILVGTGEPEPSAPSTPSTPPAVSTSAPTTGGSPRATAKEMLGDFGWGSDQWSCLDRLWQRESNWNPNARNASSGAYGIPQALPGSKMASAGSDWQTNPATQIKWGLGYIKGRYGSPCGAWGHSQQVGWY